MGAKEHWEAVKRPAVEFQSACQMPDSSGSVTASRGDASLNLGGVTFFLVAGRWNLPG